MQNRAEELKALMDRKLYEGAELEKLRTLFLAAIRQFSDRGELNEQQSEEVTNYLQNRLHDLNQPIKEEEPAPVPVPVVLPPQKTKPKFVLDKEGSKKHKKAGSIKKAIAIGAAVIVIAGTALACNWNKVCDLYKGMTSAKPAITIMQEEEVAPSSTPYDEIKAEDFIARADVKNAIIQIINVANEARLKGADLTEQEAIALYCGFNVESSVTAQQISLLIFASPQELNNTLNSAMIKINNAQYYGFSIDLSPSFPKEEDQKAYEKFHDIVSRLLVAEKKAEINSELNSFLRETFETTGSSYSPSLQRTIIMQSYYLNTLNGISIARDLHSLFLKDNDKIPNCDVSQEIMDNLYNEQQSELRQSGSFTYTTDKFLANGIKISFEERLRAKEIILNDVKLQLKPLGITAEEIEARKAKYKLKTADLTPAPPSQRFTENDLTQVIDGKEVIVVQGENKSPGIGTVVEEEVKVNGNVVGDTTNTGEKVQISTPSGTVEGTVNDNGGTELKPDIPVLTPEQLAELIAQQQKLEAEKAAAQAAQAQATPAPQATAVPQSTSAADLQALKNELLATQEPQVDQTEEVTLDTGKQL